MGDWFGNVAQLVKAGVEKANSEKLAADVSAANKKLFTKKQKAKMRAGQRGMLTTNLSDPNSSDTLGNSGV